MNWRWLILLFSLVINLLAASKVATAKIVPVTFGEVPFYLQSSHLNSTSIPGQSSDGNDTTPTKKKK